MYAVVSTGGKQIRVREGDVVEVERCAGAPGDEISFDRVLCLSDGGRMIPGDPTVAGASVRGLITAQTRGRKITVFRYKAKVNYRKKTGHRQDLTRVRITGISYPGGESSAQADAEDGGDAPAPREEAAPEGEPVAEAPAHPEPVEPGPSAGERAQGEPAAEE